MSVGQDIYETSIAYAKFKYYSSIGVCVIIGICLISCGCSSVASYIQSSNTPPSKTEPNNAPSLTPSGTPSETLVQPTPIWLGPGMFLVGIICIGVSYFVYNLINSNKYNGLLAAQGALNFASDIRNVQGGYVYFD